MRLQTAHRAAGVQDPAPGIGPGPAGPAGRVRVRVAAAAAPRSRPGGGPWAWGPSGLPSTGPRHYSGHRTLSGSGCRWLTGMMMMIWPGRGRRAARRRPQARDPARQACQWRRSGRHLPALHASDPARPGCVTAQSPRCQSDPPPGRRAVTVTGPPLSHAGPGYVTRERIINKMHGFHALQFHCGQTVRSEIS